MKRAAKSISKTVRAVTNKTFVLELTCSAGTGYAWHLAQAHPLVKLVRTEIIAEAGKSRVVGGTARQRFELRATAAGSYELTFGLKRAWETSSVEWRTFSVEATD